MLRSNINLIEDINDKKNYSSISFQPKTRPSIFWSWEDFLKWSAYSGGNWWDIGEWSSYHKNQKYIAIGEINIINY